MQEKTIWGIHAGKGGTEENLFLNKNVIAIGWAAMGDLSLLRGREAVKSKYSQSYPNAKKGAIPVASGQLYRFVNEISKGDLVAYLSPVSRELNIGEIVGDYEYNPDLSSGCPNQRKVKWLKSVPRKNFSQGALYEISSAMTLFQIKNYADEYYAILKGEIPTLEDVAESEEILNADDIEELTRDFVLKQLSKNLKGLPLEEFVAHLLEKMGYKARLAKTNEPSVDIIAYKDELGFEPPIIKVQVKSSDSKISDRDVSALYGKVERNEFGLLVTLGDFTPPAVQFANSKSNLRLINGSELVDFIFEYYETFDSKYKGILPLRSIYVPESVEKQD